ncbi:MAG: hypothetical protein KAU07_01410 [Candidatus Andersenbacteria bacterium]|nr:hypothetical protein [Candidatus Andersenbacteria bacterium]
MRVVFRSKPNKENYIWEQIIKILPQGINYKVNIPKPFLIDGYKNEMNEALEKIGLKTLMETIYQDAMTPEEFLKMISFVTAYKAVYEKYYGEIGEEIHQGFYENKNLTIAEFLEEVEKVRVNRKDQELIEFNVERQQ